jgi:hypothetical protein
MIRTLREAPEVGSGTCTHVDVPAPRGVLVHRADDDTGTMVFVHNLGEEPAPSTSAAWPPRPSPRTTSSPTRSTASWASSTAGRDRPGYG